MSGKGAAAAFGVAIAGVLMVLQPFDGLDFQGTAAFSVLLCAIVWWIAGVLPDYVVGLAMTCGFVVLAGVPVESAFSAFSSSPWWLMVAAFCLGHGMQSSGLVRRIALFILDKFSRTFRSQAVGLMAAGMVAGPFIPSLAAKCAMLTPLAMSIGDQMGYERKGRQANGLFLAVFTGVRNVAPAIISASFVGYSVLGLLPDDVQRHFDMMHWFVAALPWLVVVVALNGFALCAMFEPEHERRLRKEHRANKRAASAAGTSSESAELGSATIEHQDLGPMSASEKQMLVIIVATVLLWVFERWHGVPAYAVALMAVVAMVVFGQFKGGDIRKGFAWDTMVFMGVVMSLASVFSYTHVDAWIVGLCEPALEAVSSNPYALVFALALITVALRFVIVSEAAFINIFMVFTVPLSVQLGVNPWVIGFCVYAMANPWFTEYQNSIYLSAVGSVDCQMTEHKGLVSYSGVYLAICLTGLLVSVPYWQWMGLMW